MGQWRGPRPAKDPIYATKAHRAAVAYWRSQRAPCYECGRPIDYAADGRNDPWALHVDHIMPVAEARARGWSDWRIAHLTNTRPLHRGCNTKLGAQLGRRRQYVKPAAKPRRKLNTSRDW